jgi:hypothetical protein
MARKIEMTRPTLLPALPFHCPVIPAQAGIQLFMVSQRLHGFLLAQE